VYNSTTLRKLLLGLAFIVASASGCGDQLESPPPPKPAVFRQKILAPKERVSETAKPGVQVAEKVPTAEVETKLAGKAEPLIPEKKPMLELPESGPKVVAGKIAKTITHLYDPTGKLDPFQSVFAAEAQQAAKAKEKVIEKGLPLTPLQKVELSQLKLVGIIVSAAGNKALVEEPSGKGYVITEGTYVGTNLGRVKKILNDVVIVEEEVRDFVSGRMKRQTTELRLQKKLGDV